MDKHGAGLKVLGGNLVVFQQEIVQGCKGIRPRRFLSLGDHSHDGPDYEL